MKRLAILTVGLVALAGCGLVPEAPHTAPVSPLISTACRAELATAPGGRDLVNVTDLALGADATGTFGPTQQATDLDAFTTAAEAMGATSCP